MLFTTQWYGVISETSHDLEKKGILHGINCFDTCFGVCWLGVWTVGSSLLQEHPSTKL